jgi:uncharacterized protein
MLVERIREELKKAMLNRDSARVLVLRGLTSAIDYKKSQKLADLSEEEEVAVLRSEVKKRNEAIEIYRTHNEPERAETEAKEAEVIKEFLPQEISEEDINKFLITEWEKDKTVNKGVLIGKTVAFFGKGRVDGSVVGRLVSQLK